MAEREAPYQFDEADGYCAITLLPELNQAPWANISKIGDSLLQNMQGYMDTHKRSSAFLVDLSHLNYIGSAMVALVVRLWKAAKEKDGRMAVVNNNENVLEVLRLSGLDGVWTITETREEGLKSLGLSARKAAAAVASPPTTGGPQLVSATSAAAVPEGAGIPWAVASLVLIVIALVGLFLFSKDPSPIDHRVSMAMLFGSCVMALIAGTVAACRGDGLPKTLGTTNVLGAIALLVAGVACHPQRDAVLLKPADKPQVDDNTPVTPPGKTKSTVTPGGPKPPPDDKSQSVKPDGKTVAKTDQNAKTTPEKTAKTPLEKTLKTPLDKTLNPPKKSGDLDKTLPLLKDGPVKAPPPKTGGSGVPAKPE